MKNILLLLTCIFTFSAYPQQWEWAKTVDINLPITVDGSQIRLAPDKAGNFYMSYFYWDNNYGYPNGSVIVKYDAQGNELWEKDFTSKLRIKDITADSVGTFYITGDFRDTVYVGSDTLISNGNNDAFLAKFNSGGNLQWIKKSGGPYNDCGGGLCLDRKGNVYMTGGYSDSAQFYGNWIAADISNMTVSKFDPSGNLLLFRSSNTPDSLQGSAQGERIRLDNAGNMIVVGSFSHIQIDNILLTDGGPYGAQFICKFDTAGQLTWLKEAATFTDKCNDFVLGGDNTIFATGGGSWTNGSWTITKRLNTSGNALWNKGCGLHCGYYGAGVLNGVANDDDANIIALGSGNCYGLLLIKYAFDGSQVYMDTIHATNYIEGKSIIRDANGKYIINGFINGGIKLGNDSIYSTTWKIFIAKFSDQPFITSVNDHNENLKSIKVFPNPSSGIFTVDLHNCKEGARVIVHDVLGNSVFEKNYGNDASTQIDLTRESKGIYFIEIVSEGTKYVNKIVVQ